MSPSNEGIYHKKLDIFLKKAIVNKRREEPNYFNRLTAKDFLEYLITLPPERKEHVQRVVDREGNIAGVRELLTVMVNHTRFAQNFLRGLDANNHQDLVKELLAGLDVQALPPCDEANFVKALLDPTSPSLDGGGFVNGGRDCDSIPNILPFADSSSDTTDGNQSVRIGYPVGDGTEGDLEERSQLSDVHISEFCASVCPTVIRHPLCDISDTRDQSGMSPNNSETVPKEIATELPAIPRVFQCSGEPSHSNPSENLTALESTRRVVEEMPVKDLKNCQKQSYLQQAGSADKQHASPRLLRDRDARTAEDGIQKSEPDHDSSPPSTDAGNIFYILCFAAIAIAVVVMRRSKLD